MIIRLKTDKQDIGVNTEHILTTQTRVNGTDKFYFRIDLIRDFIEFVFNSAEEVIEFQEEFYEKIKNIYNNPLK